jgi:predicted RNase H-like nuclease (RuvC/YqgF family)
MDGSTFIALGAMLITLFGATIKYIDRWRARRHEAIELAKKQSNLDVERDSIVVRGAEGALILMERTLKTANDECEKRISELEEENHDLKCQIVAMREELKALQEQVKNLTKRVDNG